MPQGSQAICRYLDQAPRAMPTVRGHAERRQTAYPSHGPPRSTMLFRQSTTTHGQSERHERTFPEPQPEKPFPDPTKGLSESGATTATGLRPCATPRMPVGGGRPPIQSLLAAQANRPPQPSSSRLKAKADLEKHPLLRQASTEQFADRRLPRAQQHGG